MKLPKKLLIFLLVSAILSVSLTACTPSSDDVDKDGSIKIVDHLGRTVELDGPAEKIVGTHNPTMNMVVVLDGDASRIVGFGSKDMSYGIYDVIAPEIDDIVQIGKGSQLNMETLMSLEPDLLLIPARFKSSIEDMDEIGLPVIALDVEKFDSIKSALTVVGQAIGQDERAGEIVGFFNEMIEKMSAIGSKAEEKPSVLMLSKSSMTAVSTDAMLQNLIIETAGGENATAGFKSDDLWTEVDIEQIISWDPDVIYVPCYATFTAEDVLEDPAWQNISAVKNKKVYTFPSTLEPWDFPVAAASLGLCWVTNNLHPELYSFDEFMADVNRYYDFVYGRTFSAEEFGIVR